MLDLTQCNVSEPIQQKLEAMFAQGRAPQALIIEGDEAKTEALAKQLAAALVCQSDQRRPCGVCAGCLKAYAGSHPDIYVAQGGLTPRSFKVEAIRAVRSDAYIRAQEGGCKVYLLLRAESMSTEAQNALLKILEEPPAQTVFILTCSIKNRLLQTVRSRAQSVTLEEVLSPNPEAVRIAKEMTTALLHTKELAILQAAAPLLKDKDLLKEVLAQLTLVFRDACVQREGGSVRLSSLPEQAAALCRAVPKARLLGLIQAVEEIQNALAFNGNMTILTTALCANLRTAAGR